MLTLPSNMGENGWRLSREACGERRELKKGNCLMAFLFLALNLVSVVFHKLSIFSFYLLKVVWVGFITGNQKELLVNSLIYESYLASWEQQRPVQSHLRCSVSACQQCFHTGRNAKVMVWTYFLFNEIANPSQMLHRLYPTQLEGGYTFTWWNLNNYQSFEFPLKIQLLLLLRKKKQCICFQLIIFKCKK